MKRTAGKDVQFVAGDAIEGGLCGVEVLRNDFLGCVCEPIRQL